MAENIVKLAGQPALGVDMCDVEEITDSRGEELTDKERILLEETQVSTKKIVTGSFYYRTAKLT